MSTAEYKDHTGRSYWSEVGSEFVTSGLESGFLRPANEPAPVDEAEEEAEDAAVQQEGDDPDAVDDAAGSGDPQPARRGPRKR